jgi:hypothetical protein
MAGSEHTPSSPEDELSVGDPAVQFAAHHLGGRAVPDDLRRLLSLQRHEATGEGAEKCLNRLRISFLAYDRLPALIDAERRGRDDLVGIARLAYARAIEDMVQYSGFVAEDVEGGAIGYWFGPDQSQIEAAPLMRFDPSRNFSILRGNNIAEAILALASRGDDMVFSELRECLNQQGLMITARSVNDLLQPKCAVLPQTTYQRLIRTYLSDLSTTLVPDTGEPADIMTTHRGPQLR